MTACISSQVGCSLSCKFCATGTMDRKRNLSAGEIYDQVVHISRQAKENYNFSLSNIVYMGMGEPLLNYSNVIQSIDRLTSSKGLHISKRRITLSTSGISKMTGLEDIPFQAMTGSDAWRHLVKICCGLDSFIVGELQVMSQLRSSINIHRENNLIQRDNYSKRRMIDSNLNLKLFFKPHQKKCKKKWTKLSVETKIY